MDVRFIVNRVKMVKIGGNVQPAVDQMLTKILRESPLAFSPSGNRILAMSGPFRGRIVDQC